MAHDLFISFAQQDSTLALELTAKLRAAGYSVWMDERGVIGVEKWSPEIVDEIEGADVVALILSPSSNRSAHVHREIMYAAELNRTILPIEVEHVTISHELKYSLAGLPRIPFEDFDGICTMLTKHGVIASLVNSQEAWVNSDGISEDADDALASLPLTDEINSLDRLPNELGDGRKSLMVLPFEDLSPTQDNGWFADGLTSELIEVLGKIRTLRIVDLSTSMGTKGLPGKTMMIAQEMDVRYFLEGHVRKFGDQIKVSVSLLDVEEGEHLWQDSHKGEFKDIFGIQEEVIRRAVEGLQLTLSPEEVSEVSDRGTANSEAYELVLKASEQQARQTREGILQAIALYSRAILLDPGYVSAFTSKAHALVSLHRSYDRKPEYLIEAETLARKALERQPDYWPAYHTLATVYLREGRFADAEEAALSFVRHAPNDPNSHLTLGIFYFETNQPEKAIRPFQQALFLRNDLWFAYQNLVVACDSAGDVEETQYWAKQALPYYRARIRLRPDDENAAIQYANLLRFAGKFDEARIALTSLARQADLDGKSFYNIACLQSKLGDLAPAIDSLQRAIQEGFTQFELFRTDIDLNPLRGLPEFNALMADVLSREAGVSHA